MSKARSIKTDLEQYLTELDKQYGNNKVSIMTPITATDPVISPLKKPVKELIKDANPELYQTELDKQYGNALPAADSNPAVKTVKKTAKEMIAEANPELYQTITNQERANAILSDFQNATSGYQAPAKTAAQQKADQQAIQGAMYLNATQNAGKVDANAQAVVDLPQSTETYGPIADALVQQTGESGIKLPLPNPEKETTKEQIEKANQELYARESPESLAGLPEKTEVKEEELPEAIDTYDTINTNNTEQPASSTPAVKGYEEWLADMKRIEEESANRQYQITKDAAQGQYDQAMYGAAVAEQKAINDAQNAYALRRATYGAQGESLGRNGLAMSGYSDYADQAAYAASRGEIAGAGAVRAGTEQQAMSDYRNYLLSAELAKEQAMSGAEYEYAQNMAKLQAQKDEQLAQYEAELAKQQQQIDASVYAAQTEYFDNIRSELMDDPDAYTVEQIQDFVKAGYLSNDMGTALVNWKNSYDASVDKFYASVESYLDSLAQSGDVNDQLRKFKEAVDDEYADNPDVQKKLYEKLMLRYAKNADESNYDQILEAIKEYKNDGKLSAIAAQNIEAEMNKTIASKFQVVGELRSVGSDGNPITGGKMIMAKTNDGETISHGYKDIVTSEAGKQTAALLDKFTSGDSNKVFSYNDHYYAKIDGKWRLLKKSIYSEK